MRQIFVRFSGCSLTCDYCDTPESRVQSPEFNIVRAYGNTPLPNPVLSEKLTEIVKSFNTHPNLHHSVSLTGGEPLEQADFLKEWLPLKEGLKIYLETNGILPTHLTKVIEYMDIIGMDIKLPSVAGVKPHWSLHREFLKIAAEKEVFVKVVVDNSVTWEDMVNAVEIVYSVNPGIPFVIQPRTPVDMEAEQILKLQDMASSKLSHVRVIPQVHKFLHLL